MINLNSVWAVAGSFLLFCGLIWIAIKGTKANTELHNKGKKSGGSTSSSSSSSSETK